MRKTRQFCFYTIAGALTLAAITLVFVTYAAKSTVPLYAWTKANQSGWKGKLYTADAELGFAYIPNSQGAEKIPMGPDIPTRFDELGFRVPVGIDASSSQRPLVLALGCSYTYGAKVCAEDAYPYLVGLSLNGTSKNGGVSSYGLSQMLISAMKFVPVLKPDYLLVQFSPWLVSRATTPFAPSHFGELPVPFFYEKDQGFALYPPVLLWFGFLSSCEEFSGSWVSSS